MVSQESSWQLRSRPSRSQPYFDAARGRAAWTSQVVTLAWKTKSDGQYKCGTGEAEPSEDQFHFKQRQWVWSTDWRGPTCLKSPLSKRRRQIESLNCRCWGGGWGGGKCKTVMCCHQLRGGRDDEDGEEVDPRMRGPLGTSLEKWRNRLKFTVSL